MVRLLSIAALLAGGVLAPACAGRAAAVAGAALATDLADLAAARDRLAARLQARQNADAAAGEPRDLRLLLDGAADGDDLVLVLRRRAGRWTQAYAAVPYWRQETQKEKFTYLHRSGVQSAIRDKFLYESDASGVELSGGRVRGTLDVTLRLDWPRDERMKPGGRHLLTVDGRWSLMDQWRVVAHRRPRRQQFAVEAELRPGVHDVRLVLHDGMDGKPVFLRFRLPPRAWEPAGVLAPAWNAGVHQADVSGLRFDGRALRGDLTVRFVPDPWYPKEVCYVRFALDGLAAWGRLSGTFKAALVRTEDIEVVGQSRGRGQRKGPAEWAGAFTGQALQAAEGRYRSSGDLGARQGLLRGGAAPVPPVASLLGSAAAKETVPPDAGPDAMAARATELYGQVRALHLALEHYPYPLDLALAKARLPPPQWPAGGEGPVLKASLEAARAYVAGLKALVLAAERPPEDRVVRGRAAPPDGRFGPYYPSAALGGAPGGPAEMPAASPDGPQKWQYVRTWRALGPLPQVLGTEREEAAVPPFSGPPGPPDPCGRAVAALVDLVPALEAGYEPDLARLGRATQPSPDGLLRWQPVEAEGGTVRPPAWGRGRDPGPGLADAVWYAAAHLVSPEDQEVWIALAAEDHGRLWINDRLVWTDEEREWGYRESKTAVFRTALRAGPNRLLARVRDDRGGSWLRLHVATAGGPSREPPAAAPGVARPPGRPSHWYPDADPPLAWDIEKGINVLWRAPLTASVGPGAGITSGGMTVSLSSLEPALVVAGVRLLVNVQPHTLVALDRETGKELWRRDSNILELASRAAYEAWQKARTPEDQAAAFRAAGLLGPKEGALGPVRAAAPVSDGRHVWVHYGTGVAACYDLDGTRRWMVRTPFSDAALVLDGDRLLLEGALTGSSAAEVGLDADDVTGKTGRRHAVLCVQASSGSRVWIAAAEGRYGGRPFLLDLGGPGGRRAGLLVTRGSQAFDAASGKVLLDGLDVGDGWDWDGVCQGGDVLYMTHEGGRAAVRFWLDEAGQVGHRRLWRGERHHAYVAGGPGGTIRDDRFLYAYRLVPEHAKHCPAYALSLDWFDPETGEHLGWVNPVLRGSNARLAPVVAGRYLLLGERRGGAHTGGTPAERSVTVVRTGPSPGVVARNAAPFLAGAPVADGPRLYLVRQDDVVCLAVTTAEGRRFQDERLAQTLFAETYREPAAGAPGPIRPLAPAPGGAEAGLRPGPDVPVVPLTSGDTVTGWLVAGPFPDDRDTPVPEGLLSATADALPRCGAPARVAGTARPWVPLDDGLVAVRTSFHNDARLDDWQLRVTERRIDVRALAAGTPEAVLYLFTVLDNPRRRLVLSTMERPVMEAWLGGEKVTAGEPVCLEPGLYPLLMRVRPDLLEREQQVQVDVAKALEAGAVRDVRWPTAWQTIGPVPEALGVLAEDQLAAMPERITINDQPYRPRALPVEGLTVDLAALARDGTGGPPGQEGRVSQQQVAYCFATIDCPADGTLLVNASADWWMAWYLDGKPLYNTLRRGNLKGANLVMAHAFSAAVTKGRHVLAVLVKPGSKGWSLTSAGALATPEAQRLYERFPTPQAAQAAAQEYRVAPSLREVDDPEAIRRVWLQQVRERRDRLEHVARALPDTDCGRKARAWLAALEAEGR